MHKKRWFMALALALALLLTGYYFASPWAMLARFKADAQARKTDKMKNYVDFVAVRASLKAQIQERVRAKIGVERDNPIAAIGMGLAILLDQKVRAEGFLRTIYHYPMA